MATDSHSSVFERVGRIRYRPCTANASGKTIVTIGSSWRYVSSPRPLSAPPPEEFSAQPAPGWAARFPDWATLPGPQWLAMGRVWHFFFAWLFAINGAIFAVYAFARGHVRELLPTWRDLRHLPHETVEHRNEARPLETKNLARLYNDDARDSE